MRRWRCPPAARAARQAPIRHVGALQLAGHRARDFVDEQLADPQRGGGNQRENDAENEDQEEQSGTRAPHEMRRSREIGQHLAGSRPERDRWFRPGRWGGRMVRRRRHLTNNTCGSGSARHSCSSRFFVTAAHGSPIIYPGGERACGENGQCAADGRSGTHGCTSFVSSSAE